MSIPESVFVASIIIAFGVVYMTINFQKESTVDSMGLDNAQSRITRLEGKILSLEAINAKLDELKTMIEVKKEERITPSEPIHVKFTEPIRVNVVYKEAVKKPLIPTGPPPLVKPAPVLKRTNLTPMLDRAMEGLHGKNKK